MINRTIPFLILISYSIGLMANGITPPNILNAKLINEGRRLFFDDTFNGNGRICGSCNPANNFTNNPKYIATPAADSLYVAEYIPTLANTEIRDAIRVLNQSRRHHVDAILSYRRALRHLQKRPLSSAMSSLQQTRKIMMNRRL